MCVKSYTLTFKLMYFGTAEYHNKTLAQYGQYIFAWVLFCFSRYTHSSGD